MSLIRRNENFPMWSNFFNDFFNRDWYDWSNRNFSLTNTTLPSVNIKDNVDAFEVGESPYRHTNIYPVCELKSNPEKKYLYAIYRDTSNSVYIKDGEELTKEQVAEYLTASEARKLLEEKTAITENVTHNIKHTVIVRTIGLGGIVRLNKKEI